VAKRQGILDQATYVQSGVIEALGAVSAR